MFVWKLHTKHIQKTILKIKFSFNIENHLNFHMSHAKLKLIYIKSLLKYVINTNYLFSCYVTKTGTH